mgnify:CR=1 FL=1
MLRRTNDEPNSPKQIIRLGETSDETHSTVTQWGKDIGKVTVDGDLEHSVLAFDGSIDEFKQRSSDLDRAFLDLAGAK